MSALEGGEIGRHSQKIETQKTREELKRGGYTFQGYETCRGPHCRAMMEIWKKEGAKILVMNPVGIFQSHSNTCPDQKRGPGWRSTTRKTS